MKRNFYLRVSVLAVSLLLLVAGCLPTVAPGSGDTLNLYGIDPFTLDPAVSGDMTSHEYVMQIFSGLVAFNEDLEPAPDIAERWELNGDGRTYTFYLRHDVVFHDGRAVTAADFKYSWERTCKPETGSQTAGAYLGDIVGVRQVIAGERDTISGVRVVDDYTLQVTIDAPKAYFLAKLTYPTALVVDRANVEMGKDWWQQPNGTGPFILEKWERNNLLILKKNGLYYGKQPGIDSVVYYLWGGVPMNLYETGQIDAVGVAMYYIDRITDAAGPFYRELKVVPELSFAYIGFDTTRPPFDDENIRRAFSMAINKEKIVALVFRDMMETAGGILPPGLPGFNEDLSGSGYDVAEARELIAASAYGDASNLPPITITTSGWGGLISQGLEAIVYEWQVNLGVEVKVRQLEPERYIYNLRQEKDEMFYMGWVADYPHPQNFLEVLFHSEADNNYGEYNNPEVDTLLELASVEPDDRLSLNLYQLAEQLLVDDAACIPLWFGKNYILVKPYVKGYTFNAQGLATLTSVSVEPH